MAAIANPKSPDQRPDKPTNHARNAGLLSIIPGLGQLYNKQYAKAVAFFIVVVSYFAVNYDLFFKGAGAGPGDRGGLWGLITLGEVPGPRNDHSIFLMVEGIVALILLFFGIAFYVWNIRDAYRVGRARDQHLNLPSFQMQLRNLRDHGFPYLMLIPSLILLVFTVILPLIFTFLIAFTNYRYNNAPPAKLVEWVGFENFTRIFEIDIFRDTFVGVLGWTLVWTVASTTGVIAIGIFLAVLLNQEGLRFRRLFRSILILSWAVPAFITILIFRSMFNESFGVFNTTILPALGLDPVNWMTDPTATRTALVLIQWWLGFPFIMTLMTGVLQSIPGDLYEAATIDGATIFDKFRLITLPMLLFATAPILITQFTFNFNNFNIIYLFNGGGPAVPGQTAGGTDILISWIYKLSLGANPQYGLAAAITLILSFFIMTLAVIQFRRTKSFKDEDMI
ncbi:ABC transporter permease subunit [Exiguobacterium profundum]|uniref:Binding-protein-dependent transport systems inner membrane component n=2 Tax=Exiguobacterium TaxID=33986 RepID=C4L3S9_EXISA|nr:MULTISPECIES: sugar ABC transporter permease [Exiguobacterium]MCC9623210.1 ABC transporter permease subunit [Thalassospira sp. MA62]QPI67006.1 sugar ABC transporter permease [Exiguobacterium sp. PBE]ACQ71424.1 binding-protein-dependent transport systems inner membrane component [Exiguobacterium sp. AT1b]MBQ6460316.1 sugar ABC transporter permease [Exiguobacterium sp.]MBR2076412.1 sugar ABC transporter permease [Exiguobacterium sp.]